MKRRLRNWWMGILWNLGLVELKWWDDVRIAEYEAIEAERRAAEEEESRAAEAAGIELAGELTPIGGEPLRLALAAAWRN